MATMLEDVDVQLGDEILTIRVPQGTSDADVLKIAYGGDEVPEELTGPGRPTGQLKVPKTGDFTSLPIGRMSQPEIMTALGFNPDDAPAAARLTAAMGLMNKDTMKVALERHYGKPVEVSEDDVVGPIFRPQGETKFRPWDIKEMTMGDLAGAAPEIAQNVPEVGLAIATFAMTGAGAHSVPAALAVETATAYGTEVAKLNIGQSMGLPVSDSQIHMEALKRAGLTAITGPVGSFLQGAFRRITGRALPADMERVHLELRSAKEEGDLAKAIEEGRAVQSEFNGLQSGTDQKAQLSLAEASGDLGLVGGENAAVRTAEGAPLKELDARNNTAVMQAVEKTFGPTLAKREASSDIEIGRTVGSLAERNVQTEAATAAEITAQGVERSTAAQREAFGRALDADTAASEARPLMVSAMNALEAPLKTERDAIVARGTDIKINLHSTRGEGAALMREIKQTKFPSLQKEALALVEEAKDAGVTLQSVFKKNAKGEWGNFPQIKKEPATLKEVMNDLSNINETLRRQDLTPKQKRVLVKVGAALRLDMNRELRKQDPELLTDLLRNNAEFKNLRSQYERGVVGKILKMAPEREGRGGFQLADQSVIPTILSNPGNAGRVAGILSKSGNAGPRALNTIRSGVLDWISESPNRFIQKRDAIKEILSERQFKAISEARNAGDAVKALRKAESDTLSQINKTLDMRLTKFDPENMVGKLLAPGEYNGFVRARELLRKNAPEQLEEFDGAVKRLVLKKLSPDGNPPTPRTIDSILDPPQGQSIQAHLREVFGDDYLPRLRTIRNFQNRRRGTLSERPAQGQNEINDLAAVFNDSNPLRGVFRFTRVAAPPLSTRGRAFTAVIGIGRENARRALVNAFVDPSKVKALQELGRTTWKSKFAAQQLSILGLGHLSDIRMLANQIAPGSIIGEE